MPRLVPSFILSGRARETARATDDRAGAKLLNFAAMGDDASSGVVIEAREAALARFSARVAGPSMTCKQHFENDGTHVAGRSTH
jgi:hypothetical protein